MGTRKDGRLQEMFTLRESTYRVWLKLGCHEDC